MSSAVMTGPYLLKDEDGQAITGMFHHYTHTIETFFMLRVQNLVRYGNVYMVSARLCCTWRELLAWLCLTVFSTAGDFSFW
jgi:hypothetical protein